ncbi:MTR1A-like protein [Mya arenaria]|uniref:MTR1A-like protein n=1 Tax=Mya arenaria TaxID=6604 RepID=A0ABY7FY03_MYAAR|nr:melatonin receptor type 1B-B-like [Mya arenaria]WAR25917.1 MTR1A-like protein [Mya arenaria]
MNITNSTIVTNKNSVVDNTHQDVVIYGRHEFLQTRPELAVPCIIVLGFASIVGTLGNLLILFVIATKKKLRNVESIFIVNLAISDLYVTVVADPMSLIGKLEGEQFFDRYTGLCQAVGSICTISCVTSLTTIMMMSINRYFYICSHDLYTRLFSRWNTLCVCLSLYLLGGILVFLNLADVGDHGFDHKSLECIWDRMATYPYTVVYSVVMVWIPALITIIAYVRIFMFVHSRRRKVQGSVNSDRATSSNHNVKSLHLAKTLGIIYAVFISCWSPYALVLILDTRDTFPHELHVFCTVFAHLHPSLNWLIYYLTNKKFEEAYNETFAWLKNVINR